MDFATRTKAGGTDVTDADLAVEELIRSELLRQTPGDEVYGEEAGTISGSSGRRWIIDPIDGTAYFVRGIPLFASLIAYEDEHVWITGYLGGITGALDAVVMAGFPQGV